MLFKSLSLNSEINVDAKNIALIMSSCEALLKGPVSVANLWPGEMRDLPSMLSDRQGFDKGVSELRSLKSTLQALAQLHFSLETKIHFAEKSILPATRHYGLNSLPDEILIKIIEHSCFEEPGHLDFQYGRWCNRVAKAYEERRRLYGYRLESIDRRFRRLSGVVKASLGSCSLTRGLLSKEQENEGSDEWLSLIVDNKFRNLDPTFFEVLPAVKDASFSLDVIGDVFKFYSFPGLTRLRVATQNTPYIKHVMPQLTYLSLQSSINSAESLGTLVDVLVEGQRLQTLVLDVRFYLEHPSLTATTWQEQSHLLTLPSLSTLDYQSTFGPRGHAYTNHESNNEAACFLLANFLFRTFYMPRLTSLSISWEGLNLSWLDGRSLEYPFDPKQDYSRVRTLTLASSQANHSDAWRSKSNLGAPIYLAFLEYFSSAEKLTLIEPRIAGSNLIRLSKLRELHIHGAERLVRESFVRGFIDLETIDLQCFSFSDVFGSTNTFKNTEAIIKILQQNTRIDVFIKAY